VSAAARESRPPRARPARSPRPWVDRVRARHRRRREHLDKALAGARRPTDRVAALTDYLRGALADAPRDAADREITQLRAHVLTAVDRLHAAELRSQP
jgi:hypothetical protein